MLTFNKIKVLNMKSLKKISCKTFDSRFVETERINTLQDEAFKDIGNSLANMLDNENIKFIIIEKNY